MLWSIRDPAVYLLLGLILVLGPGVLVLLHLSPDAADRPVAPALPALPSEPHLRTITRPFNSELAAPRLQVMYSPQLAPECCLDNEDMCHCS